MQMSQHNYVYMFLIIHQRENEHPHNIMDDHKLILSSLLQQKEDQLVSS